MAARSRWFCWLGASLLFVSSALAQDKAPAGGSKPAEVGADKGQAGKGAEAGKGGDADKDKGKEADKPPGKVGGYSWSDAKPKKGGGKRWRKAKIDPNAPIAMYPGFRMLGNGTSQVWVYVSRKVSISPVSSAGRPTFLLSGAQVATRNNTNALVTEYFDTPMAAARLRPGPAGAQLELELREPVSVTHRVVDGPGGTTILYVDLPKAQKSYSLDGEWRRGGVQQRGGLALPSKSSKSGGSKSGPNP